MGRRRRNLSDVMHRRYRKRHKNDVCFDIFLQFEINLKRARKGNPIFTGRRFRYVSSPSKIDVSVANL